MEKEQTLSEKWESLTLANNFIFCKVMESRPDLCKHLLEILLHIKIDHIEIPEREKDFKVDFNSKGIRFDVFTQNENQVFDIEIQTTNKKNLRKRARYYQGMIDITNLETGDDYEKLKDSYIIFLCFDDIFKRDFPVYFFENLCIQDTSIKLKDNSYKIFFNVKSYDKMTSKAEKDFFAFLYKNESESDFTDELAKMVVKAKQNIQWRHQFMTWEQSIHEEAEIRAEEMAQEMAQERAEKIAQKIAEEMSEKIAEKKLQEKQLETARNFINLGLPLEQIAQGTGLPLEQILKLQKDMQTVNI